MKMFLVTGDVLIEVNAQLPLLCIIAIYIKEPKHICAPNLLGLEADKCLSIIKKAVAEDMGPIPGLAVAVRAQIEFPGLTVFDSEKNQTGPPKAGTEDPAPSTFNPFDDPLQKKCEENDGAGAYNRFNDGVTQIWPCLRELLDILSGLNPARLHGQLREAIDGYCNKTTHYKVCLTNLTEVAAPCFNSTERTSMKQLYNLTGQMLDFVCLEGRDSFTLFIAEGGIECIMQKRQKELQNCFTNTFTTPIDEANIFSQLFGFQEEQCNQYKDFEKCVLPKMNSCEKLNTTNIKENDTTIDKGNDFSNFVEQLFKLALEDEASPCQEYDKGHADTLIGSSSTALIISLTLVVLILVVGLATLYYSKLYLRPSRSYPAGSAQFIS